MGLTFSLQSSPSMPFFSSLMPTWQCASMSPGMTQAPSTLIIFFWQLQPVLWMEPSLISAIFPFWMPMVPFSYTLPAMVNIFPPVI